MAGSTGESSADKYLAESLRRFCRSIELCDDYLRGYYGLKLVCKFLDPLQVLPLTNNRLPTNC